MIHEPGDRKGRPYMKCRSSVLGYVGATLAVARQQRRIPPSFWIIHRP